VIQPFIGVPTSTLFTSSYSIHPPIPIMVARYAPLVSASPLHNMPQDYQTRIPLFDGTRTMAAHRHVDNMNAFFDLQEVDEEDVKMRLFSQSLNGQVRDWFKSLPTYSLNDITSFHQSFLNRWEVKKNPLHILFEYESIKISPGESVQDYCTRFNNIYIAIPIKIKSPQGLALIKFPDVLDADMSY
jgi:hypothetical protein